MRRPQMLANEMLPNRNFAQVLNEDDNRPSDPLLLKLAALAFCCGLLLGALVAGLRPPNIPQPPAGAASTYPAFDAHADEHVTIAADPYDTKEKASCFRMDYLKLGFMPIRVIVTNDGDKPISLEQARIHFITAAGDKIPAAEPEDVERRATNIQNPSGGVKLPIPGLNA
jgi:hypothetical protein